MHLLIILALLVWTLVGLWLLRRMWAISAAERRERRELRRAARCAQELERREREERLREQTRAQRAAERERRAALRVTKPAMAPLGVPFAATIALMMWVHGARVEMIVYAIAAVAVGVMLLLCLHAITHAHAEGVLREAAQRRLTVRTLDALRYWPHGSRVAIPRHGAIR